MERTKKATTEVVPEKKRKVYEMCFLGRFARRHELTMSYWFRPTQVTEITDPSLPGLVLDEKPGDFAFAKPIIKSLSIGDYVTAETENGKTYKDWKRCHKPQVRLADDVILAFSVEDRARKAEANALRFSQMTTRNVDKLVEEIRDCMYAVSRSERAAFAMYVYQQLMK